MLKGGIQQEDIILVNIYPPSIGAPKDINQILMDLKGEMDSNTVIAMQTSMDGSPRQNINKETVVLNDRQDEMDVIDNSRVFNPKQ